MGITVFDGEKEGEDKFYSTFNGDRLNFNSVPVENETKNGATAVYVGRGANNTSTLYNYQGEIAEIIYLDKALSDGERVEVEKIL